MKVINWNEAMFSFLFHLVPEKKKKHTSESVNIIELALPGKKDEMGLFSSPMFIPKHKRHAVVIFLWRIIAMLHLPRNTAQWVPASKKRPCRHDIIYLLVNKLSGKYISEDI